MNPDLQALQNEVAELKTIVHALLAPTGYAIRKDVVIGTGASRVGFFAKAPVAQQTPTGENVMGIFAGTTVTNNSTWTGSIGSTAYTPGDVVRILKLHGILKT